MTIKANPYETPQYALPMVNAHDESPPASKSPKRSIFAAWLLAFLYPVWLLGSLYFSWLIAWFQLGHRPRPMLDDPKSLGGIAGIAYFLPGILMTLLPVLAPIGLAASFFCPIHQRRTASNLWGARPALIYIVLCAIGLLTLWADPGRVVEWWFD